MNDDDFDYIKLFRRLELMMMRERLHDLEALDAILADGYLHPERQARWDIGQIADLLEALEARAFHQGIRWWESPQEGTEGA